MMHIYEVQYYSYSSRGRLYAIVRAETPEQAIEMVVDVKDVLRHHGFEPRVIPLTDGAGILGAYGDPD